MEVIIRETIQANAPFFDSPDEVPKHCITMGIGTIMKTRHRVVLTVGEGKAEAVVNMIEGPVTASCPASILQMHPRTTVIADSAAARHLQNKFQYAWGDTHKLDWQRY